MIELPRAAGAGHHSVVAPPGRSVVFVMLARFLIFSIAGVLLAACSSDVPRPGGGGPDGTDSGDTSSTMDSSTSSDSGGPDSTDTGPITSPECENVGELYCNGVCLLPVTDDHCRECNRRCGAGQVCLETAGVWDCGCPGGTIKCDGACTDPLTDADFCGASGTCEDDEAGEDCGANAECLAGQCRCLATHVSCDGECVDPLTDEEHCGFLPDECGIACMANGVCTEGTCECPAELPTDCDSIGCVDPMTNNNACGGCVASGGEVCDTASGFTCQEGTCQCAPGLTLCGGVCTDTATDPDNCGGCYDGGAGTGVSCDFVDTPSNTVRQGCFAGQCVDSPCDPVVMDDRCDGLTLLHKDVCYTEDDHFVGLAVKCDNNSTSLHPTGIPLNTEACYEILNAPDAEEFRCWWSGRSLVVNGVTMACNNDGSNYLPLPPSAGHYCVYFPATNASGSETDGFAMGSR